MSTLDIDVSDRIQFFDDVVLDVDSLSVIDKASGRRVTLNQSGFRVVAMIGEGVTLPNLAKMLAGSNSSQNREALSDISQLIEMLNDRGMVRIKRATRRRVSLGWLLVFWNRILVGELPRWPMARVPATHASILRSTRVLGAASAVSAALASLIVLLLSSRTGLAPSAQEVMVVAAPTAFAVTFWLSVVCHESGHLAMIRRRGLRAHYVALRGASISIHYSRGTTADDQLVGLAGPLAGGALVAVCATLYAIGASVTHAPMTAAVIIAVLALVPQLWSALPWSNDGRLIWTARATS